MPQNNQIPTVRTVFPTMAPPNQKTPPVNNLSDEAMAGSSPKTFEPITREIDPTQETVAGRLPGLLEKESPYMKGARYRGEARAAQRGLLESTIAGESGEKAAIEAALPIAQQDAETYARQRMAEQAGARELLGREQTQTYGLQSQRLGYEQDLGRMGVAQQQELERMGAAQKYEMSRLEILGNQQLTQMEKQQALNAQTMELEAGINERLYGVQQQYAVELEGIRNQFDIQKNLDTSIGALYSDGLKSISNFLDNPNMTKEQQEAGLDVIIGNLQSGLNFLAGISGEVTTSQPEVLAEQIGQEEASKLSDIDSAIAAQREEVRQG